MITPSEQVLDDIEGILDDYLVNGRMPTRVVQAITDRLIKYADERDRVEREMSSPPPVPARTERLVQIVKYS